MNFSKYEFRENYNPDNRAVKQEDVTIEGKEYFVSTVDLGLDYSFGDGPPLYYETMIFPKGEWRDLYCNRYTDRETALKEHEKLVDDIKNNKYRVIEAGFGECFERIEVE